MRLLSILAIGVLAFGATAQAADGGDPGRLKPKITGVDPARLETLALRTAVCGGPWERDFVDEAKALRLGTAKRAGRRLTVGKASFGDQGDEETGVSYDYMGRYGLSGVHLVHIQYYEGDGYILVDPLTGAKVELASMPLPSPDGRFFVALSGSEYTFSGVQVVERTPGGWLTRLKVDETKALYPCGAVWQDNDTIRFKVFVGPPDQALSEEWTAQAARFWVPADARKQAGTWRFFAPQLSLRGPQATK